MTGFGKTDHPRTKIEIHFIAEYNSHIPALHRHSDNTAIDGHVCFYWRLFADPVKPCRAKTDPLVLLRSINKTAWGVKLLETSAMARGMV